MVKAKRRPKTSNFFKKRCKLCDKNVPTIDYKDVGKLKNFISKKGKILSRRITGNCAKHQDRVEKSIKRARFMALLPYISE